MYNLDSRSIRVGGLLSAICERNDYMQFLDRLWFLGKHVQNFDETVQVYGGWFIPDQDAVEFTHQTWPGNWNALLKNTQVASFDLSKSDS